MSAKRELGVTADLSLETFLRPMLGNSLEATIGWNRASRLLWKLPEAAIEPNGSKCHTRKLIAVFESRITLEQRSDILDYFISERMDEERIERSTLSKINNFA